MTFIGFIRADFWRLKNIRYVTAARTVYRHVRQIAKSGYWCRHICLTFRPYTSNNSAPTGQILVKFDVWVFFENLSLKFEFYLNLTRTADTVHLWHLAEFSLEWEIFQTRFVEKIKTHILCSIIFVFENHFVYSIMWKHVIVEPDRPHMTIWRMCFAWWIAKTTDTQSGLSLFHGYDSSANAPQYYVSTYIACLVYINF
jgi:hypothetical protein